jgi:hypothetical protein
MTFSAFAEIDYCIESGGRQHLTTTTHGHRQWLLTKRIRARRNHPSFKPQFLGCYSAFMAMASRRAT